VRASPGHAHHGVGAHSQRIAKRRGRAAGDTERQVVSHHRALMAERIEAGLPVVGPIPLRPTPPNGAADGIIWAAKSLRATPPLRVLRTKVRKSASSGPYQ